METHTGPLDKFFSKPKRGPGAPKGPRQKKPKPGPKPKKSKPGPKPAEQRLVVLPDGAHHRAAPAPKRAAAAPFAKKVAKAPRTHTDWSAPKALERLTNGLEGWANGTSGMLLPADNAAACTALL